MSEKFAKLYNPNSVEDKWYEIWLENKIFQAKVTSSKPAYSILMPPPNVTGILHFGHVLNQTLQDLYVRWKRMNGFEVCWFPGIDHAGIATQTRVEAELRRQNLTKYDLGREKFVEKVWQWKEKYGGIILQQLKKLGISCDWDRTLFTMDESASNAVREVFIRLFDQGLIYKGKRIINWSPLSQTALSDEEVEFREVKEKLYTLRYYIKDSSDYLCVSTARPETIFGDVAVAINPNDERYTHLLGQYVIVPLVNRIVPVIADEYADPEFGTGCVKITPAHDPNDFEVGLRHSLPEINTINPDGTLNELTGEFSGLDRFKARKLIVQKLNENNLIEKVEDYTHNVGFSQRGGEPIEPYLSDQWFVKMKPLAEKAIEVVKNGEIKFFPNHWVKTYEHWLSNVKDWCISRQLWWGHRIPVYYTPDGTYTAASSESEARKKLNISNEIPLRQEEDVLDTWFSSWLWPLTTMRWLHDGKTEDTEDLRKFLPTDLLVTAPDIIFFWVARMIMATYHFKKQIPFKDVYFTSTIRDGLGRKLSKSLGNSPDPLDIIDKYGADAVRFTMIYLSPLGQDIKMDINLKTQDIPSMEIGRNFANKIWNAARFLVLKQEQFQLYDLCPAKDKDINLSSDNLTIADKWILSRYNSILIKTNDALNNYRVNEYSKLIYDFVWRDFCDWYIEIVKVQTSRTNDIAYNRALIKFSLDLFEGILKILHPIMPFITEEIWHIIWDKDKNDSISLSSFPESIESHISNEIEETFYIIQLIVEEIRSLRSMLSIQPSQLLKANISASNQQLAEIMNEQTSVISSLTKCEPLTIGFNIEKPQKSIVSVVRDNEIHIELNSSINLENERNRLKKEMERLNRNIIATEAKLSNDKFLNNAPPDLVNYEREKLENMKNSLLKIKMNYDRLI